jgi:hypothetical protein
LGFFKTEDGHGNRGRSSDPHDFKNGITSPPGSGWFPDSIPPVIKNNSSGSANATIVIYERY